MITHRQAIKYLKLLRQCGSNIDHVSFEEDDIIDYIIGCVGTEAKGCEYCNGTKSVYEDNNEHYSHVRIMEVGIYNKDNNSYLHIEAKEDEFDTEQEVEIKINYCPDCGRKLTKEEAEAEVTNDKDASAT